MEFYIVMLMTMIIAFALRVAAIKGDLVPSWVGRLFGRPKLEEALTEAAAELGLKVQFDKTSILQRINRIRLYGRVDGQEVSLEQDVGSVRGLGRDEAGGFLRISPPRGVAHHIQVRREDVVSGLKKLFVGADIQTGDRAFDKALRIEGDSEAGVIGVFDCEMRRLLYQRVGLGDWVVDGEGIRLKLGRLPPSVATVTGLLREGVELSRHFDRDDSVEDRLCRNLRLETNIGVRVRNLEMLLGTPRTHRIQLAIMDAASDPAWDVSVRAAEALGLEGQARLASAAASAPPPIAKRAVAALGRLNNEEARAAVRMAIEHPDETVAASAAATAAELRDAGAVPALGAALSSSRGSAVRIAAAKALGLLGSEASRIALAARVQDGDPGVALAAIAALARCGSVDDIVALLDVEQGGDRKLRAAARNAIASIQAQLDSREPGWLSVAEQQAADGALSLDTSAPMGSLSMGGRSARSTG
ncbi:MAG: HEAT repeat domain-containing protein [Acidobacteriota bacterium]